MKTIRQVIIRDGLGILEVVRYDVSKQLLYKQNRSKDLNICLDDFLDRLKLSREEAKRQNFEVIESRVESTALWPQK